MEAPILVAETKHQAAMAARITGIILNALTLFYHPTNLRCADHPFRFQHLLHGMREKEDSAFG